MKHLSLKKIKHLTIYQKMAIGTWKEAKDPSIYGWIDIDFEPAQKFAESILKEKGIKLTPTHIVTQAVSLVCTARPQLNALLRGNMLYQRDKVSISCLVSVDNKKDHTDRDNLSSCVVHDTSQMGILDLYKVLKTKIEKTKSNQDEVIKAQTRLLEKIPSPLMKYFLNFLSFITYALNLKIGKMPYDPFGSVMISNLGQMGIDNAFIPLVYYARVPVIVVIGSVKPRPAVMADNTVRARNTLRLNFTIDHRYIDGKSLSVMNKMLNYIFSSDPKRWLTPPPIEIQKEFVENFCKK